jgi:hypothetical protein
MENNKIPKIVLDAKLNGKRKVVRPNVRWLMMSSRISK